MFWGGLVGLFTGGVTVLYRLAVHEGNHAIWGGDLILRDYGPVLLRFLLPPLGGLVVGYFLYKVLHHTPGHGIPSIIHSVQTNQIRIPWKMAVPSITSVVVLTTGGSAGPEGPVAEIGSVFGSNVGKAFGAHQKTVKTLVGAGVAAAIAAIFGAPIGGVFFAVEVIFQGFEVTLFGPILISAVIAFLVRGLVFTEATAVVLPVFTFHPSEFPAYLGLGLLMGLAAIGFIRWMGWVTSLFGMVRVPLWIKPALGGLGVGLIGLFLPRVIGEGYESLNQIFRGEILIREMAIILLGKVLATSLTIGSGAPGGCFAPAIFVGVTLGGLYGAFLQVAFPTLAGDPTAYALVGMAGMIAGTFNAPMTAILIGLRTAQENFDALIPLMTTVALASLVMSRWDHVSIYTQILRRHGQWFPTDYDKDPLLRLSVEDVLIRHPRRLTETLMVSDAFTRIRDGEDQAFVVTNERGDYQGIVTLKDLRLVLADPMLGQLVNLADVIEPNLPILQPGTTLRTVVELFSETKLDALPVFSPERLFLGLVTRDSLLEAYQTNSMMRENLQ
jgi:CIC family chloride channel protein